MSKDAATQRAPGNAFQRVIDSSHVDICLIIIMSRASLFEVVVERKKKRTPPNTREMKCFNKDGVGGVTISIQTGIIYPHVIRATQRYLFKASVSEEAPYLFEVSSFRFQQKISLYTVQASFFFTGMYLRCRRFQESIKGVVLEGGSDVSCSHNTPSSSRRLTKTRYGKRE